MQVNMYMLAAECAVKAYTKEAQNISPVTGWSVTKIPGVYPAQMDGCTQWTSYNDQWVCMELLNGMPTQEVNNG